MLKSKQYISVYFKSLDVGYNKFQVIELEAVSFICYLNNKIIEKLWLIKSKNEEREKGNIFY